MCLSGKWHQIGITSFRFAETLKEQPEVQTHTLFPVIKVRRGMMVTPSKTLANMTQ